MAAAAYFDTVQKIFIAFYQRPADPAGLKYWADRIDAANGDAAAVVSAFATSPEAVALYGTIDATTIGTVIDKIYLALFNTAPDAAGKKFYVDGFTAGKFTAGTIALNILNGATNDDAVAIANKLQVSNTFTQQVDGRALTSPYFGTGTSFSATYKGDADAQAARDILKTVTASPSTVLSPAQVTIEIQTKIADAGDPIIGQTSGQTFTLTANIDNIVGTSGNDTVIGGSGGAGSASTLGSADVINGGAGTDTMKITTEGATVGGLTVTPNLTSMEKVEVQALTTTGTTVNMVNATGTTEIWNVRSTDALTVTNVQEAATVGMKGNVGANAYRVGFKDSLASGTADSANVALEDAVTTGGLGFGGMTAANEFETINIAATGTNSINQLQQSGGVALAATKTVNVTGAGKVTVTSALAATVTSVDASANTGGVSFDLTATGAVTAKGGSGADTFQMGASLTTTDVLTGGDGTDIIGVTTGASLVTGLQVTGFETLDVGGGNAAGAAVLANSYDLSKLAGITTLKVGSAINADAGANDVTTINNLAKGAGVEINAALGSGAGDQLVINVKDAGAGSPNDSINVLVKGAAAVVTTGDLDINDIETVTLTADKATATGAVTHTISNLIADEALTVKVANGNAALTITDLNAKALVLFDATEATQAVSVSVGVAGASDAYSATNGVAFKLGAGADTLVLTGATTAGGDFYITGGAGGDKITLSTAAAEVDRVVYTSAADSVAGLTATLASKYDVINTFEGAGTDKIDLKALNIAAGQQSSFVKAPGTAITSTGEVAAADKLNFFVNAGAKNGVAIVAAADVDANTGAAQAGVFVYVDANGDGNFDAAQDLTIALVGVTTGGGANDLAAGNFVFA